jgi:AsmA protein
MFKKLVLIFIILIAIVIGALVIFVATFDANDYKQEITTLVKKQTGRDLSINGDLKLAVYPDVALEMGKTSLSNAEGFSGTEFATIDSGKVSVKLLPLLKKKIEADAVLLDGLNLNLHRKADGSSNWDDLVKSEAKPVSTEAQEKEPSKVVEEMLQNLSIAGISLKNANIIWRDDQAKQQYTLAPLNLTTGKFSPGKPLPVELVVVMKQKNPPMTIAADGNTTISLSNNNKDFSLSKLKLNTKITGAQIPKGSLEASLSGNIKGSPQKITVSNLSLQSTLTGDLIPQGAVKTNVTGNVDFDVNTQQLTIAGMKIDGTVNGKPLAGGTLQALITGDTKFNLKSQQLSIPNLVLDTNLADGYVKGGSANAKVNGNAQFDLGKQLLFINGMKAVANANGDLFQGGKASTNITGDLQLDLARSQVKSPQITLKSQIEGGLIPGGKLTQSGSGNIDLNWANKKGAVNLSNLLVNLAGLEVKGSQVQLQPLAAKPAISGQFQTNTFNLKTVMKTFGIKPPATKNPAALSQIQAQFALKADTDKVDLQGLKAKVDKSQLSGNMAISNFTAPSIRTQLTVNSINLDDYLAPEAKGTTAASSESKTTGNQELLPLDTLRKLNIDGDFKIGNMVINKIKMSNINAKVNAKQGLIIIDPANAQLYSGNYKGRITLDAKQATPTMKMRHELVGIRSEGLLFDLFQDKYVSGGAKLVTELSSRGNSIDALLKNLNGTTSLGLSDGTIRDSNLAEKVSLAVKAFEKKDIKDGKSVVKFTGLSGDFKTTNGVFATNNLSLSSPYFNIKGTGTANVANQKLDMKLRIGPNKQDSKRPLFAPLRITGTFTNPKFSLDLKDLIKALAAQDIEELKLKAEQKIAEQKQVLKLKLEKEKAVQEQKIKQKLQDAKEDAVKKLKSKTGNLLGDGILNKLGGKKSDATSTEKPAEEPKSVEDQVKDKLKNKLKNLF